MMTPPWKMKPSVVVPCAGLTNSITSRSKPSSCVRGRARISAQGTRAPVGVRNADSVAPTFAKHTAICESGRCAACRPRGRRHRRLATHGRGNVPTHVLHRRKRELSPHCRIAEALLVLRTPEGGGVPREAGEVDATSHGARDLLPLHSGSEPRCGSKSTTLVTTVKR